MIIEPGDEHVVPAIACISSLLIEHDILLNKLQSLWMDGVALLNWFHDYLTERTLFVVVGVKPFYYQ